MVDPLPEPDTSIDPDAPVPDDPGELLPDAPEPLPPAPIEPTPDDPGGDPGGVREPAGSVHPPPAVDEHPCATQRSTYGTIRYRPEPTDATQESPGDHWSPRMRG